MLNLWQNKWTIKARVTSKGDVRTWNKSTGSGKLFSMDLMDESGAIRVMPFTFKLKIVVSRALLRVCQILTDNFR